MTEPITEVAQTEEREAPPAATTPGHYQFLQVALFVLRAGPALILGLLVVAFSFTTPIFFTSQNIGNIFSQTAVIAVLALGQLLVIISRGIALSVGSTVALSGVVGAIVFTHVHSTVLVILAILGTGLAVGLVNGLVFVLGRIPHPFIVTLASLSIVSGIAFLISNGTLIPNMPAAINTVGGSSIGWFPYATFVVIGLALATMVLTTYLVWGRWLYAVGGNPDAARLTGIPVGLVLVSVYAISGLFAGVGGLLNAGLLDAGSPTAGQTGNLDSIAAVIIGGAAFAGGRGNVGNALVGAFTIGVIRDALNLNNVNAFWQLIAIGLIVVLAVEGDVIRSHVENRVRLARSLRQG